MPEDRINGPKLIAEKEKAKRPKVKTGEDFEWTIFDYMQAPFGFIIGALQALPAKSASSYCSLYTSSARQYIITGREQMEKNETNDALTSFHDGFSYIDQMGPYCVYAFQTDLSVEKFKNLIANPLEIGINLLYNFGFMFTDVMNYLFYTPKTVP